MEQEVKGFIHVELAHSIDKYVTLNVSLIESVREVQGSTYITTTKDLYRVKDARSTIINKMAAANG